MIEEKPRDGKSLQELLGEPLDGMTTIIDEAVDISQKPEVKPSSMKEIIDGAIELTEKMVLKDEPTEFQRFAEGLKNELDYILNPKLKETGDRPIGYCCFIFDRSGVNSTATLISNSPPNEVFYVTSKFVNRQKSIRNKKIRQSTIKRVK